MEKSCCHGDPLKIDAVEIAVHGIEAVGESREKELSAAAVEEGIETKSEGLVGTVPHKDHFPLDPVNPGNLFPQPLGLRVRVQPEPVRIESQQQIPDLGEGG